MFKWVVRGLGACLVVSVVCVFGWFVARSNARPDVAIYFAVVLKYALYVMAAAAIYSAAVGAYHTFLSVTGLDRGGEDEAAAGGTSAKSGGAAPAGARATGSAPLAVAAPGAPPAPAPVVAREGEPGEARAGQAGPGPERV
ncbi:MAG TPA: hypothetical protein VG389_00850 [Myxococcota bacterium]|nr:hypothetical protein [Myxococcota bacterium]